MPICLIMKNFSIKEQSYVKLKRNRLIFWFEFISDLNDQILNTNHSISADSHVNESLVITS